MLKIKDSVDLKELEKFGLQLLFCPKDVYVKFSYNLTIDIKVNEYREVIVFSNRGAEILFDLIQAGLVEKVGG